MRPLVDQSHAFSPLIIDIPSIFSLIIRTVGRQASTITHQEYKEYDAFYPPSIVRQKGIK